MRIGFIGTGIMGEGMAANLLAAGRPLSGFDTGDIYATIRHHEAALACAIRGR